MDYQNIKRNPNFTPLTVWRRGKKTSAQPCLIPQSYLTRGVFFLFWDLIFSQFSHQATVGFEFWRLRFFQGWMWATHRFTQWRILLPLTRLMLRGWGWKTSKAHPAPPEGSRFVAVSFCLQQLLSVSWSPPVISLLSLHSGNTLSPPRNF